MNREQPSNDFDLDPIPGHQSLEELLLAGHPLPDGAKRLASDARELLSHSRSSADLKKP